MKDNSIDEFDYDNGITEDLLFKLPEEALTGEWAIQVETKGQVETYSFVVRHYVAPLANLTISLPTFIKYDDLSLPFSIDCLYTFGKKVQGDASISIKIVSECDNFPENIQKHITKSYKMNNGNINGTVDLRENNLINVAKLVNGNNCAQFLLNFTAIVKDSKIPNVYTNHRLFYVYQYDIMARQTSKNTRFVPGSKFFIEFQVTKSDNTKIERSLLEQLYVSVKAHFKDKETKNANLTITLKERDILKAEYLTDTDMEKLDLTLIYQGQTIKKVEINAIKSCGPTITVSLVKQSITHKV